MSLTQNIHAGVVREKIVHTHRLSWADHARGMAIILVVYRHVAVGMRRSDFAVSDLAYNLQEIFFNFRMPVFFALSGIFVANSLRKRTDGALLKDKIYTLLYPYLLWGFILMTLEILFSQFTNSKRYWYDLFYILTQPRAVDHLWYLFALFNTTVLYLIFKQFIKNKWLHGLLALALHCLSFLPALKNNSLVSDAFHFYPFFYIGTQVSGVLLDKTKSESLLNLNHLKWLLPLCIAGQWFWFTHRDQEDIYFLLFFLITLIACYVVYIIAFRIAKKSSNDWLAYMGSYSLYIYILHVPVAAVLRNLFLHTDHTIPSAVVFLVCWIGGLLIPIVLFNALKGFGFKKMFSLKTKSIQ